MCKKQGIRLIEISRVFVYPILWGKRYCFNRLTWCWQEAPADLILHVLWEQLETISPYTKRLTRLLNGLREHCHDVFRAGWVSFSAATGQFRYTKEFGSLSICTITVSTTICRSLQQLPILQFVVCIVCFIGETSFHSQSISYSRKEQTEHHVRLLFLKMNHTLMKKSWYTT